MHSDNQLDISPSAKYRFQLANRQKDLPAFYQFKK